jgi:hypothetical protein
MTAWLRMSTSNKITVSASFKSAARLMLYAAPLTVAMWLFFPRIATPFWAVPIDTLIASRAFILISFGNGSGVSN